MKINHLQLNISVLRNPAKVTEYIRRNQVDIACLQEIAYSTDSHCPIIDFLDGELKYSEGVHFHQVDTNQTIGCGIISKFPVIDEIKFYFNSPDFAPKQISNKDLLPGSTIHDQPSDDYPGSRGLKHALKSRCVLVNLLQTPKGLIRVICCNYTVTDLCTETEQTYNLSLFIKAIIQNSKDIPTILSGDMNIRAKSYSVNLLNEALSCHTLDIKDTLSEHHRAKLKDFPNGLDIDHVFSKGLNHESTITEQIDFSDHKALLSKFSL